jgi:hypothetical protein
MKMLLAAAGLAAAAATAGAAEVTLPKGTVVELTVLTPFDSGRVAKGDTFRAEATRSVYVDGRRAIPKGAVVIGDVKHVRSPRDGAKSAAIGVKFEELRIGGRAYDIEGVLTSLKADDRKKILEHQAKLATGRKIDVVLIGEGTAATRRVSTLVGTSGEDRDDLADEWAVSALGPDFVAVTKGTVLAMRLDDAVTVAESAGAAPGADDRVLIVAGDEVRRAQRALLARGLLAGEPSGTLDDVTRNAIAGFQIEAGLPATGDLDRKTLLALDAPKR